MQAVIDSISKGSLAEGVGLEKGDILLSINDNQINDFIDYLFYSKDPVINIKYQRKKKVQSVKVRKKDDIPLGIELKPFRIKPCRNKCSFCFVNQLPKGMRRTLYLKDDDYRMSFLYGNFITLSNISSKEKKRIIEQKLSPIYISVHTTNNELRRKMLGNPKAQDILTEIQELVSHRIRIHAQIVLCPGLNDGEELVSTISDLQKFYPYVSSIAVVPVGFTKYNKSNIRALNKEEALNIIDTVKVFRRKFRKRHGDPLVYAADELYLKAGLAFPPVKEYGDLPQLENGVGLVPLFIHSSKQLRLPKKIKPRKVATFTGISFKPYLDEFAARLNTIEGLSMEVFQVENRFFGPDVTVTGLLTGKDVLKTVLGKTSADCFLVPDVVLRDGTDMFLDNVTLKDLEENLGMSVKAIDPTPKGILKEISHGCERED